MNKEKTINKEIRNNTIFEGNFKFNEDGNVVCCCGNNKFITGLHMDYSQKSVTQYTCDKCGESVMVTVMREMV